MNAAGFPLLSLLTFLPLAGAAIIMFVRGDDAVVARNARWTALWTSLVTLVLSLVQFLFFGRRVPIVLDVFDGLHAHETRIRRNAVDSAVDLVDLHDHQPFATDQDAPAWLDVEAVSLQPATLSQHRHGSDDDRGDLIIVLVERDVEGVDQLEPVPGQPDRNRRSPVVPRPKLGGANALPVRAGAE